MKRLMNSTLSNKIYLTAVKELKGRPGLFVAQGKKGDYTNEAIRAVFEWFMNNFKRNEPSEAYEVRYPKYPYVLRMTKEDKEE